MSVKVKKADGKQTKERATVSHYYNYKAKNAKKASLMVYIKGDFFNGGFSLSKNKAIALIQCLDEIKGFATGNYDVQLSELNADQILAVE